MKIHDEIKNIIKHAKTENDARIELYQWGMKRGYARSDNPVKERFLTNALTQPLNDIVKNPNILWNRDKCKDDKQIRVDMVNDNLWSTNEESIQDEDGYVSFDNWMRRHKHSRYCSFYDACAFVSSVLGSNVFNSFLQSAKITDMPKFQVIHNPGFISGHVDQFITENEWRLSNGEKQIYKALKEICKAYKLPFPQFPIDDMANELWSPIEYDDLGICGWLCINRNTKHCYIVKIY